MEKNGEHIPEKDTDAQKEVQKTVYKPIQKIAGIDWGTSNKDVTITSVSGFFMDKDMDLNSEKKEKK